MKVLVFIKLDPVSGAIELKVKKMGSAVGDLFPPLVRTRSLSADKCVSRSRCPSGSGADSGERGQTAAGEAARAHTLLKYSQSVVSLFWFNL